ncbi:MAG: hypothetical protein FWC22_00670 [Treponema sp.]|nr:hypothetical protein [Treponema sp.]
MKTQFKYAIKAGLFFRGPAFAVIFIMNTVFIILGSLGLLPLPAHITAVSLCGVSIAVMFAANIAGDVSIGRRMFLAPGAYLDMLTPVPRWKILLASIITMTVMDVITLTCVIVAQVWLSFNMIGNDMHQMFWSGVLAHGAHLFHILWFILLAIVSYILLLTVIIFCVTMKKSIFFKLPASGFLAVLLAFACFYVISLLQLVMIPFSEVQRHLFIIYLTVNSPAAIPFYVLFTLLEAAGLFVLTSKLLERRINL